MTAAPEWHSSFKPSPKENHFLLDLQGIVHHQLGQEGIQQIELTNLDTYNQENEIFSCRRSFHRNEQLQCALEISLRAVGESQKGRFLDERAYKKFWWAYHGRDDGLQLEDIRCLCHFSKYLATSPAGSKIWGPNLRAFAHLLLDHRKTMAGLQLVWTLPCQLRQHIHWIHFTKALIKPYVPKFGLRLWSTWQYKKAKWTH